MRSLQKKRDFHLPSSKKNQQTSASNDGVHFDDLSIEWPSGERDPKQVASRCLQVGDLLLLRGDAEKAHTLYRQALYLSRTPKV